jgi:hypothetical protein
MKVKELLEPNELQMWKNKTGVDFILKAIGVNKRNDAKINLITKEEPYLKLSLSNYSLLGKAIPVTINIL